MHNIPEEAVKAAVEAVDEGVNWVAGLFGEKYDNAEEVMRSALTAALPLLPVQGASAARELALEEAARVCDAKIVSMQAHYDQTDNPFIRSNLAGDIELISHLASAIRALSSPVHADAGKVESDGWKPIESAPTNRAIQIFIPNADYYGNDGVYAGILVDLGTGQRWATFGWAVARDLPPHMHPSHWRPLPSAPSEGAE